MGRGPPRPWPLIQLSVCYIDGQPAGLPGFRRLKFAVNVRKTAEGSALCPYRRRGYSVTSDPDCRCAQRYGLRALPSTALARVRRLDSHGESHTAWRGERPLERDR